MNRRLRLHVAFTAFVSLFLLAAVPPPLSAQRYVVASDDRLASLAALEVLRAGGNAADAAVAAGFALAVVNPWNSGLGGGGFALFYRAESRTATFLDFRETAPAAASRDMFLRDGAPDANLSRRGGLSVATPGEVLGLSELARRHGRLGLARNLAPAVRMAERGFPAPAGRALQGMPPPSEPEIARLFWTGPNLRPSGSPVRQADLARTLRAVARSGPDAFYRGPIAQRLVEAVRAAGGILTAEDLAAYRVVERPPLRGRYRGREVYTAPPPSSGGLVLLEALALLERHDLARMGAGSSAYLHVVAEALKAGFADRAQHLGDPDFVAVPVAQLLDPERLRQRSRRIRTDRATPASEWAELGAPPDDHGTTHVSVIDEDGNAVALTLTLNLAFGSHVVARGTGVILNDQMDDFTSAPGVPNAFGLIQSEANAIAPRKRPLSSMTPTVVIGPNGVELSVGGAGGPRIISGTLQALLAAVDFGLDASRAVSMTRVHHQWMPDELRIESDTVADVCQGLVRRGHRLRHFDSNSPTPGRVALVLARTSERERSLEGASDPRGDGAPAGD